MPAEHRELWAAFITALLITVFYLFMSVILDGIPSASSLFGHLMGIAGFILMIMTEILYTIRKRSRRARWGRMSNWLDFHIITGIVGPYLVILHSGLQFNGLAGLVTFLTILVAGSGFVGRYIFTAIPRNADGIELEAGQLESEITALHTEIQHRLAANPGLARPPARSRRSTSPPNRMVADQAKQLQQLVRQRNKLERQAASLARSRQMLALWHTIHIPLGMALFTAAFIHIGAAIYYAGLFR